MMNKPLALLLVMAVLAVTVILFIAVPAPLQAQQNSATPSRTASRTPSPTAVLLLENVPVARGGIEVFPLPDRKSGRIFAAVVGTFAPHVVGRSEDEKWLYIYYFDRGVLKAG